MIREKQYRALLIFWCLFIGIGALWGGACMIAKPSGELLHMETMLPYFTVLPFSEYLFTDYFFSGFALIAVNGITNIVASILLFNKKKSGIILGTIFGSTLMLWITIQFVIFPPNVLDTAYFTFGLLQFATGYRCYVKHCQETFVVDESLYTNVGTNDSELVVYFSREGYTKKVAYELANKTGAHVTPCVTSEKTDGTTGFWWCGRFAMHRWPMETKAIDISRYQKVTVCSPVWVFSIASPIRDFCTKSRGTVKEAEYVLVHFNNSSFLNLANQMDEILGIKRSRFTSIRCRMGKMKTVYTE